MTDDSIAPKPVTDQVKTLSQQSVIPKETLADTKPAFKRPERISITGMGKGSVASPQASYSEKKVEERVVLSNPFTLEEMETAWHQFAETIPELGRIKSFILSTLPTLISTSTFEITVSNVLQEKELSKLLPDIISFMKLKLQNSSIIMTLKIAEETAVQRSNSPEDRYKIMVEQNPALDKLRNALGLEID